MPRLIVPEDWRPKDVASLEPTAQRVVRGNENTLIIAGPGAGKTELLAQRACYLLETGKCPEPLRILAISLKRDAAKNLRDRVARRVGLELARRFDSLTFDAFAKSLVDRFLKGVPTHLRPTRDYIIDTELGTVTSQQRAKLRALLNSVADELPGLTFTKLQTLSADSVYTDHVIGNPLPAVLPASASLQTAAALALWQHLLRADERSVLSFQMIGCLAELLLRENQRILRALRATYAFVFLDEFQDTTKVHYALTKTAFQSSLAVLTAVGDEKQRIMIWAGALQGVFTHYLRDFAAQVHGLVMNYRSAPQLVRIQSYIIAALDPAATVPHAADDGLAGDGECHVFVFPNHEREADYLASLLEIWIKDQKLPMREVCILVRNRPDRYTETLRQRLEKRGIRARVENLLQDLLAEPLTIALLHFLKVTVHARAPDSWEKATALLLEASGLDDGDDQEARKVADRLSAFRKTFSVILTAAIDEESLRAALEQITDFIGPATFQRLFPQYRQGSFYVDTLSTCAHELARARKRAEGWAAAIDDFEGINAVPIMTVHKSKGLEYNTVVFVGLEDAALWGYARNPEEETCGFFVAFSRAKKRVFFTFCEMRPDPRHGQLVSQDHDSIAPIYELLAGAGIPLERIE
jgi:superfamily I DNA/RNA helicase